MYKSKLQELCQKRQWRLPTYTSAKQGLDHNPSFSATVIVNGQSFRTATSAKSSKEAQNEAAGIALHHFSQTDSLDTLPIPSASSFPQPSLPSSMDIVHKGEAIVKEVAPLEFTASNTPSKLSETNVNNIVCHYKLDEAKVHCPREGQTADKPPKGQVALCEAIFKAGGYFPLHSYYVKVLDYLGIAPMQLAPNSWLILACMCILYHQEGYEDPTPEEIGHLYGLKKTPWPDSDHGYYCLCRHVPQSSLIEGVVSNADKWKSEFFFVSGVPVKNINFQHAKSRITRTLHADAAERVKNILGLDASRKFAANLFKEETLRMSGLLETNQVVANLFKPLLIENFNDFKHVVKAAPKHISVKLKSPPSKRQKKNSRAKPAFQQTIPDEVSPNPNQTTIAAQDQASRPIPSQLQESTINASELMVASLPSRNQELLQKTPFVHPETTMNTPPPTKVFSAGLGLTLPLQDQFQVSSPGATSRSGVLQDNGILPDQLRFVERVSTAIPKVAVLLAEGECRSSNSMVFPQIFDHALARSLVTTADVLRCTELYKEYEAKCILLEATHKEEVDQLTRMGCELQQKCGVLTQQNEELLAQKGVLEIEKASLVQSSEALKRENFCLGEELARSKAVNIEKVGVIQRLEGTQAKVLKDLECKRLDAEQAAKELQELKNLIFTLELENKDMRTRCEELESLDKDAIADRTSESLLYTLWSEHPEYDYSALGTEFVANCIAEWTVALGRNPGGSGMGEQDSSDHSFPHKEL